MQGSHDRASLISPCEIGHVVHRGGNGDGQEET
jgi:hypothetical protein